MSAHRKYMNDTELFLYKKTLVNSAEKYFFLYFNYFAEIHLFIVNDYYT